MKNNFRLLSAINLIKTRTLLLKEFFLDLIFPKECLGCGQEGIWLCSSCFNKIKLKTKQECLGCKKINDFGQICQTCAMSYHLDGVLVAVSYDEKIIVKLIKSFKYYFIKDLAQDLAKILISFLDDIISQDRINKVDLTAGLDWHKLQQVKILPQVILNLKNSLIIPVPLSKRRLRWRGFNQAEILARAVAENYNLELNTGKLIRMKHKKPQTKLGSVARQKNIQGCFAWQGENLNKQNIILIDDVVTTGATLNECAKVLKANGAGQVWGLVVAKG